MNWNWILPESFSTYGPDIDQIYYIILAITGVVFFATEALLVFFMWRYRHREGQKAEYIQGSKNLEIAWTTATILILIGITIPSVSVWRHVKGEPPDGALEIVVTAKQYEWNVTYPGPDETLGTSDDFSMLAQLHVPVDRPVLIHLRAEDVLHALFIPAMRVKQDAIPGKDIPVWFEAVATGDYVVGCAELCGLGHYRMQGRLTVHSPQDYGAWIQSVSVEAGQ